MLGRSIEFVGPVCDRILVSGFGCLASAPTNAVPRTVLHPSAKNKMLAKGLHG